MPSMSRRQFLKVTGTTRVGSSLALMGFAPGIALKLAGLQPREASREGFAFVRSAGGFYAGVAVAALLMAQYLIYMAIGGGFAIAAFGRILSLMSDGSFTMKNLLVLAIQAVLAALPLGYAFGFL